MPVPTDPYEIFLNRVFKIQISLLAGASALVMFNSKVVWAFGFDWIVFILGCLGASIAMQRKVKQKPELAKELAGSMVKTLMPLLYGGLMAGIAYMLFISGILSGKEGDGLLASNLFPDFILLPSDVNVTGMTAFFNFFEVKKTGVTAEDFMKMAPRTVMDLGKLWTWGFMAGYSESFVTGILDQLQSSLDKSKDDESNGDESEGDEPEGDESEGDKSKGDEPKDDEPKDDEPKDDEEPT